VESVNEEIKALGYCPFYLSSKLLLLILRDKKASEIGFKRF